MTSSSGFHNTLRYDYGPETRLRLYMKVLKGIEVDL